MQRLLSKFGLLLLITLVGGIGLCAPAHAGTPVNLGTRLTGPDINGIEPDGHTYYNLAKNGHSWFGIEVENVDLPDGTTLNVNLNGTAFTSVILMDGEALWRLNSALGDVIPVMASSGVISVTDADDNVIESGTLHAPLPIVTLSTAFVGPEINHKATTGSASYLSHGARQIFKAKVKVNLIDGTDLTINDNGVPVATGTLAGGIASLDLDTNNGDAVPGMTAGDVLTVTLANDEVILVGILEDSAKTLTKVHASLGGPAIDHVTPFGNALYRSIGKQSSFTVGALNVNLPDGTIVSFDVNGVSVGMGILRDGRAFLRLDTEDGDTVPVIHVGDVITVTDSSSKILLHGKAK